MRNSQMSWNTRRTQKCIVLGLLLSGLGWCGVALTLATNAQTKSIQARPVQPVNAQQIRLGRRLFNETRFSTPKGDLPASCTTCHLFNQDPQGLRAYADFLNRSWFSHRPADPRRSHARNAPVLFDLAQHSQFHYDGEFASLPALISGTFTGRPMGWLPDESATALAHLRTVLLNDGPPQKAGTYQQQFQQAYGLALAQLDAPAAAQAVANAVTAFLLTLRSPQHSPYDRFLAANQLREAPVATLQARLTNPANLKLTPQFDATALRGMQIFFRTTGSASVGNCVACHTPPLFTDLNYHNIGVSQSEYDELHGAGSFAALTIPATAVRPGEQWRRAPERQQPALIDLGHWNFVNVQTSPLRGKTESDAQFLERMIGTFKTPTLRHLAYSYPYLHNGSYADLAATLREKARLATLARAGQLRAADAQLLPMRIDEADIVALVQFLNTLNEDLRGSEQVSRR